MLYPPTYVPAGWVVVGPVDEASLLIPDILAVETHGVAFPDAVDAGRKVDIVLHEHREALIHPDDEPLVPGTLTIVGQRARHNAFTLDLDVALTAFGGPGECRGLIAARAERPRTGGLADQHQQNDQEETASDLHPSDYIRLRPSPPRVEAVNCESDILLRIEPDRRNTAKPFILWLSMRVFRRPENGSFA